MTSTSRTPSSAVSTCSQVGAAAGACCSSRTWSSTERGTAINTHPHVVAAAATALLKAGAREVVVAEGPGHRRDIEYLLAGTGLTDVLKDLRLRFVDLNHDDVRQRAAEEPLHRARRRCGCRSNCCSRTSSSRCRS